MCDRSPYKSKFQLPGKHVELCTVCNCHGTCVPVPEGENLSWPAGTTRACTCCIYERRRHHADRRQEVVS